MASKKRKVRRIESRPLESAQPQQPTKPDDDLVEDDEQVDYEVSEDIRGPQQPLRQPLIHPQHLPEDDYEDPEEDPDGGDGAAPVADDSSGDEDEEDDGEEDDDEEEEDVGKLLEPLPREQLISLLRAAAATDPRTLAEIRRAADEDPNQRRIFVHGINYSTTNETLRSFFTQYGDIETCKIITDRNTGKSKGYGFILYRHRRAAQKSLKEPQKVIDGRMTACQMASAGPLPAGAAAAAAPGGAPQSAPPAPAAPQHPQHPQHSQQAAPYHTPEDVLPRKIFVGNVHPDTHKDRLLQFFSQYGEIEEGPIGFDRQTGKAKGYALFIYKAVEGARRALQEPNKNFDGRLLYCQRATDSQRAKAAAAAAASGGASTPSSIAPEMHGNMGYGVAPGGTMAFPGPMDIGFAQGLLGAAIPFAQGVQANPAALAMLAAAGQNPAAFGVPPGMIASLNPALAAAAMNQGGASVVPPPQVPPVQGYGMSANAGYQNVAYQGPPAQQSAGSYQGAPVAHAPAMRPTAGPMGGYGPH